MIRIATRLIHNSKINYFNPHQVLGVQQNATQDEIKRAYRKLAKKHHPDLSNSNKEKFQEVQKAYDILSGKEGHQQQQSQRQGSGGFNPFGGGSGGFNPFSGFGGFGGQSPFGGSNPFEDFMSSQAAPTDLQMNMSVSFLDAVLGTSIQVNVKLPVNCKPCKAKGHMNSSTCPTCKGMGIIERVLQGAHIRMSCPACGGSGSKPVACKACGGNGYNEESRTLKVNVPPKTKNGDVINIYHEDKTIHVTIRVKPHSVFRQTSTGSAECTVKINVLTALLGGKIDVPGLHANTKISVKEGTTPKDTVVRNGVQYKFDIDMKLSDSELKKIKKAFANQTTSAVKNTNDSKDGEKNCEKGIFGNLKTKLNQYIHPDNNNNTSSK